MPPSRHCDAPILHGFRLQHLICIVWCQRDCSSAASTIYNQACNNTWSGIFLELKIAINHSISSRTLSPQKYLSHSLIISLSQLLFFVYSLSNITWAREECNFSSFFFSLSLFSFLAKVTQSRRAPLSLLLCLKMCGVVWIIKKKFPPLLSKCMNTFLSLSSRSRLFSSSPTQGKVFSDPRPRSNYS